MFRSTESESFPIVTGRERERVAEAQALRGKRTSAKELAWGSAVHGLGSRHVSSVGTSVEREIWDIHRTVTLYRGTREKLDHLLDNLHEERMKGGVISSGSLGRLPVTMAVAVETTTV